MLVGAALLALAGVLAQRAVPRDLLPDLGEPQLVVAVEWMDHPASEVADRIARPLAATLGRLPGATEVRGWSMEGMVSLSVVFRSESDLAPGLRQLRERIEVIRPTLPPEAKVQIGPDASSTGWVFQYALLDRTHGETPFTLRRFQDDVLRPALAALPGVAEVASVGGQLEVVRVDVQSDRLRSRALAFGDVLGALRSAFATDPPVKVRQLQELPVTGAPGAASTRLGDVAQVRLDQEMSSGLVDVGGRAVAVGGIVVALRGADVPTVVAGVRKVLAQQRSQLRPGVELLTAYDRSEVVSRIERTLWRALGEEVVVVGVVIFLFLLHLRSALVPLVTLTVVVLLTFAGMWLLGIRSTLMSLGGIGIALGLAVDADVVALEAGHRGLEGGALGAGERRDRLLAAAGVFGPAVLVSLLIAALSFLPVLAFSGETGRLLRPLALTKTLVILAAALVAVTLSPVLRQLFLRGRTRAEFDNPLTRTLVRMYRPFVHLALDRPVWTLLLAGLALLSAAPIATRLGGEFLPRIDEGDLLFMPTTLPGAPPEELAVQLRLQDSALGALPEVATVFGKVGRADTATDPAPLSMAETTLRLLPRERWPLRPVRRWYSGWAPPWLTRALGVVWPETASLTVTELIERLDRRARLPGWTSAWTAPARARLDMVSTGIRTPVGVRIVSPDPARLEELGRRVRAVVAGLPGTRSAVLDAAEGQTWLTFAADPGALSAHAVDPERVTETTRTVLGGGQVGTLEKDGRAVPVRLSQDWTVRGVADQLRAITVRSSGRPEQPVPLALLGRPVHREVAASVRTDGEERVSYLHVDVSAGTDLLRYVESAKEAVRRARAAGELVLAPGERLDWIGQYPLLVAGSQRLAWIVPLVLLSMLGLLYWQFRSLTEALIVLVSVPFALVGSVWTLHWLGYPLSAPVWVGLLSVAGLAMQTGVVMVVYIDDAFYRRLAEGRLRTREDIVEAHAEGTVRRLRPKIMTITTMGAGLLPLLWAKGAGAEIMKRVAAPMLGGLVTSAFLTLEVLPVLYTLWRARQLRRAQASGLDLSALVELLPRGLYSRSSAATDGTPLVSTRKSM